MKRIILFIISAALYSCSEDESLPTEPSSDDKFGEIRALPEVDVKNSASGRLGVGKYYTVSNNWSASDWTKTGDFDGDGDDDIGSIYFNQVLMKLSNGENVNYASNETWNTDGIYTTGDWTFSGDFNGDGFADIVSLSGSQALIKLNNQSKGFNSTVWSVSNQWGGAGWTVVGDFDGDGDDDIASANGTRIFLKKSFRTGFSSHTYYTDGLYSGGGGWTFACDYNADGLDDIVSINGDKIYVKQSNVTSGGNFDGFSSYTHLTSNLWSGSPLFTWVGDTDGDGEMKF